MIIGVPKEVKKDEYRVALLPVGAHLLTADGHLVLVERGAGSVSGLEDKQYVQAGAEIVDSADEVYARAEMVVKVKEPQQQEIAKLRFGQIVFCYFHFAASRELTTRCLEAGISAMAYETLSDASGRLPLLTPMSEIAGRMSIQEGAKYLERPTTHSEPTYVVDGVVHYCVTNIPGAVSRTSSHALCNATLPYIRELASLRLDFFVAENPGYAAALNMREHRLVNDAVAQAFPDLPKE